MRQGALTAAWLCLLLPAKALAMHCTASRPATADLVAHGLLSPSQPVERRRRLADRLLCSALAGNPASQELAGELYLEGPGRPGNVLPRDVSRARRLLTAAADRGRRHAMHELQRLELADEHPYEAAMWARVEIAIHGAAPGEVAPLHRRIESNVSPDSRLDADVRAKLQVIREAMETEAAAMP